MALWLVIGLMIIVWMMLAALWRRWSKITPRFDAPRWRTTLFFLGLVVATVQGFMFPVYVFYGMNIGGWSHNYHLFFLVGRANFYAFLIALLATIVGKQPHRALLAISSLLVYAYWLSDAMGT